MATPCPALPPSMAAPVTCGCSCLPQVKINETLNIQSSITQATGQAPSKHTWPRAALLDRRSVHVISHLEGSAGKHWSGCEKPGGATVASRLGLGFPSGSWRRGPRTERLRATDSCSLHPGGPGETRSGPFSSAWGLRRPQRPGLGDTSPRSAPPWSPGVPPPVSKLPLLIRRQSGGGAQPTAA